MTKTKTKTMTGKISYKISPFDYEGCTEIQESQGNCLNDPNKTCYCSYKYPTPKPVICKQGKQCEKYVINNFYTISLHKLTNPKS